MHTTLPTVSTSHAARSMHYCSDFAVSCVKFVCRIIPHDGRKYKNFAEGVNLAIFEGIFPKTYFCIAHPVNCILWEKNRTVVFLKAVGSHPNQSECALSL